MLTPLVVQLPVEDVVEILKDTLHSHAQWGNMLRIIGNATYEADKKFFRVSTSGAQLVDYAKLLNRCDYCARAQCVGCEQ